MSAGDLHARAAKVLGWTVAQTRSVSLPSLREMVRPVDPRLAGEMSDSVQSGRVVAQRRTGSMDHLNPPTARESELAEMKHLLNARGYNPLHAYALLKEGMGPEELAYRLRHDPNDLERTHGFIQGAAPDATSAPLPGQRRSALHPRSTARRAPKTWEPGEDFDLRSEMETGYTIADKGSDHYVSYAGRVVYHTTSLEDACRRVGELQASSSDYSNVFAVNERGNVDLLKLLKRKPYYRVLHSWV